MRKIFKLLSLLAFMVSFFCMLCVGNHTAGQQILWTFGWMIVCGLSGSAYYKLKNPRGENN